ncbi:histone deacetylase complex subunit SAP130-B isoform X2 [Drosophila tropicalis]|uniref:histone deacetylase complex subunit SAP130-B isoform X2 n=1 Tax=Drosophila tropicalis TaxID=46794 RepID=UPI0035AB86DF
MSASSEGGAVGGGGVGGGTVGGSVSGSTATTSSVAAKITHVKSDIGGGISITAGTPIISGGTIKVATAGSVNPVQQSNLTGGGTGPGQQQQQTTAASIRAIGAGGQSTQVRVVMPMIKQLENVTATGRTQITAIPAGASASTVARSVSNASITVTRPVTQGTYLPRASVTATQMSSVSVGGVGVGGVNVGVGVAATQRLVTPLRATSTATVTPASATPAGLQAGGFIRGTTVSRSSNQPPNSTVISSANSATAAAWGQVQLIRAIHQPRQRIITTSAGGAVSSAVAASTPAAPVQTPTALTVSAAQPMPPQQQPQQQPTAGNSQAAAAAAYVATVLPPRQPHQQATLVYSSNPNPAAVVNPSNHQPGQPGGGQQQQQQQFNPRFAVATPTTTPGGSTVTPRQVRPIPLGKSFPAAKLNTTSISIRAPSMPPTQTPVSVSAGGATVTAQGRGPVGGTTTTTNLPTTRIIQLQQPGTSGATAQQIIGSTTRLTGNVMLQPFLMSTTQAAKMGIRPPVTMTAKVQPSLTITQLNPIGKLSASGGAGGATGGAPTLTPQGVASIQAVPVPSGVATGATGVGVATAAAAAAAAAAGGATVLPLTISGRGGGVGPGGNILTGTLTPIKNASGITGVKMMMTQATSSADGAIVPGATGNSPAGFQRTWNPVVASQSQLMKIEEKTVGGSGGGAATIYYESMPASASTGVLSLTTATVSQSSQAQPQLVSSAGPSSLSVSSLPFGAAGPGGAGGAGGPANSTFTVLPSGTTAAGAAGARAIGHQQLIIPAGAGAGASGTAQHMVIPLHTSVKVTTQGGAGAATASGAATIGPAAASAAVSSFMRKRDADGSPIRAAKNLQPTLLSMASGSSSNQPTGSAFQLQPVSVTTVPCQQQQPVTSLPPTSGATLTVEALAKRGSNVPINSSAVVAAVAAAAAGVNVVTTTRNLRAESPASSDGSTTVSANSSPGVDQQMENNTNMTINRLNDAPPVITNAAGQVTSSGRDNATHFNPINELYASHQNLAHTSLGVRTGNSAFVDVQAAAAAAAAAAQQQQPTVSALHPSALPGHLQQVTRINGTGGSSSSQTGFEGTAPRKKPRRSTNDSQQSIQSQASLTLPPPTPPTAAGVGGANAAAGAPTAVPVVTPGEAPTSSGYNNGGLLVTATPGLIMTTTNANDANHRLNPAPPAVIGNKENANPVDFVLKRPRNCALLNTYKPTHKLANNHFHRYTDVKPREERRASVIDLANQPNVQGKINGWKIYHLRSQMEDLNESEMVSLARLETMLKELEKDKEKHSEIERVNELLKGNIQRSKIISDGIGEAQNQLMKIFDHKPHVSDIINRCASKRNFKKREKV